MPCVVGGINEELNRPYILYQLLFKLTLQSGKVLRVALTEVYLSCGNCQLRLSCDSLYDRKNAVYLCA